MVSTRARADAEAAAVAAGRASAAEADAHALLAAAYTGDLAALRPLLVDASPTRIDRIVPCTIDAFGDQETPVTALAAASVGGHSDCVAALLSAGADVDLGLPEFSALMCACIFGHSECVATLLDSGSDVNQANADSLTPLHCAIMFAQVDTVKILLAAGADIECPVEMPDDSRCTPLCALATIAWNESVTDVADSPFLPAYATGLERADVLRLLRRKRREVIFTLLRAGADLSCIFEYQPSRELPGPTRRRVDKISVEYRDYFQTLHTAGGFGRYSQMRQYQLTTIRLLARGCGRLNLPEPLISIIQEFWAKKTTSE